MPDLSTIRLREDSPDVRWVLFIDGIPYAWTTDGGQGGIGTLRGTGASSWIGLSEDAIGGGEVVGTRTVLGGLEVPRTIREAIDVKSGDMEPSNGLVFRLHDIDGDLAGLFGREHKLYDVLGQRLPPGTAALPATAIGVGGAVVNLWGRHVGIERVGPAGERRTCPALPFTLVGFDHAVQQNVPLPGELPPVVVSDEPRQWAGRLVTLYAVYRDPDSTATDATAWPTWDEQHEAGNLVWVGVLRGVTRQRGGVFELTCYGRDALLRRQLGVVTTATWMPAYADLNLSAEESGIAVFFEALYDQAFPVYFDGSVWDHTLSGTSKADLVGEIATIIAGVVDGSDTNYAGSEAVLEDWTVAGDLQNPDAGIETTGLWLRKDTQASDQTILVMYIAAHGRVWRQLGYEPETQHFDTQGGATENGFQAHFTRLTAGQPIELTGTIGGDVPGDGYWLGRFTTVAVGYSEAPADSNEWDNNASKRYYRPKFSGEPFTLDLGGDQIIRLGGGTSPYIEGQLTIPHSGGDVDGLTSERARFFAFRGKVQRSPESEPEDTVQVALLEWNEGTYGTVNTGATGVDPAFRLVRWMDPRFFGFPYRKLSGVEYWTGVSGGDGAIEAAPMHAYAYFADDVPEYAHNVFSQILLSTGSGGGYSGLSISDGDNAPSGALPGPLFFGSDLELADLGLGVPNQLVAPLDEIRDAFDTVPGGWAGPLNRVRYAYIGPFLAQDTLASLMRSRRLIWRLHGGRFGVAKLAPFGPSEADVSIGERDLWPEGNGDDPRAFMPDQLPNPVGYLDAARLLWRLRPDDDKTLYETKERARDPEARARTGELVEEFTDHGLLPPELGYPWSDEFRQLWAFEAAGFFSFDHYSIHLTVSRPKGQDIRPGTRVLLNNPWPHNNAGGYGLTNHTGIVTAVEIDTATHARRVELFVFAGQSQGWRHFAPMARVLDQDSRNLTISTDQYGHGDSSIRDGDGLAEPWWSTIGGAAVVQILYRVGETFTLGSTHAVVAYDPNTATLTLDSEPTTTLRDADRWVILANFDGQDPDAYTRTLFGAVVLDNLQHGSEPTPGSPFHP